VTGPGPAAPAVVAAGIGLAVLGCVVLLARPAFLPPGRDPTARLVVLFVVLGAVGAWWPLPGARGRAARGTAARRSAAYALAVGCGAFVVGRVAMGGPGWVWAPSLLAYSVAVNSLAAVAEEAFFRRLLYGLLERWGTAVAVAGSAAAFAVVHVTVWGWWVLPIDFAAGLLLSWQRAASGRWSVPAATHVLANVLALV
jgi:membrane protease YdiL (CAAX protease family)